MKPVARKRTRLLEICIRECDVLYEGTREQLVAAGLMHGRAFPADAGPQSRKVRHADGSRCGRGARGLFWLSIPHEARRADADFQRFLARILRRQ